jgi:hypothetical protein
MTPPGLKDISACCGNCDHGMMVDGLLSDNYLLKCGKYGYILKHPAFVCDDYINE